jgi:hypothetical protein
VSTSSDVGPAGPLEFERFGLGYVGRVRNRGLEFRLDRVRERFYEINGELSIALAGARVMRSSFNASSTTSRRNTASYATSRLNGQAKGISLADLLDEFCVRVLEAEHDGGTEWELAGTQVPEPGPRLLMDPFLPMNKPSVLFADGGTGKSHLSIAFAVSVQTGAVIIPGIVPARTGPALYLDWETDFDAVNRMVREVCAGAHIPPIELAYLRCHRPLADMVERIAERRAQLGAELLVIDSVGLALGPNANASPEEATSRYFLALRAIGGTSQSLDHVPKNNSTGKPYGSVYKSNYARSTWEAKGVDCPPGGNPVAKHIALYHRKANTTALMAPRGFGLSWTNGEFTIRQEPTAPEWRTEAPAQPRTHADRIADAILEAGHALDYTEIARITNIAQNTVRSVISRYLDSKWKRVPGGFAVIGGGLWDRADE